MSSKSKSDRHHGRATPLAGERRQLVAATRGEVADIYQAVDSGELKIEHLGVEICGEACPGVSSVVASILDRCQFTNLRLRMDYVAFGSVGMHVDKVYPENMCTLLFCLGMSGEFFYYAPEQPRRISTRSLWSPGDMVLFDETLPHCFFSDRLHEGPASTWLNVALTVPVLRDEI